MPQISTVTGVLALQDTFTAQLNAAAANLGKVAQQMGSQFGVVNKGAAAASVGFGNLTTNTRALSNMLERTAVRVVALGAAYKTLGAVKDSVSGALDLNRSLTRTITLTNETAEGIRDMGGALNALGVETAKGPKAIADALYFVASSGNVGTKALDILTASARGAALGMGDADQVARAITSTVNAYGEANLSAARAADVLFASVREGGAEAKDLAGSIGRVVAIAHALGVEFSQVGAFVAAFTRLGVSADEAVTALRGTLIALEAPNERTRKGLKAIGLSAAELKRDIATIGLAETLVKIVQAAGGSEAKLREVIPNVRAFAGVLSVASTQGEELVAIANRITNSTGDMTNAFKDLEKSPAFQWDRLTAQIEVFKNTLGTDLIPALIGVRQELAGTFTEAGAHTLADQLIPAVRALGDALVFFVRHLTEVKSLVEAIIAMRLASWIAGPLNAMTVWGTATAQLTAAQTALAAATTKAATSKAAAAVAAAQLANAEAEAAAKAQVLHVALFALVFVLLEINNRITASIAQMQRSIEADVAAMDKAGKRLEMIRNTIAALQAETNLRQLRASGAPEAQIKAVEDELAKLRAIGTIAAASLDEAKEAYASAGDAIIKYRKELKALEDERARALETGRAQDPRTGRQIAPAVRIDAIDKEIDAKRRLLVQETYNRKSAAEVISLGRQQSEVFKDTGNSASGLGDDVEGLTGEEERFANRVAEATQRWREQLEVAKATLDAASDSLTLAQADSRQRVDGLAGELAILRAREDRRKQQLEITQAERIELEIGKEIRNLEDAKHRLGEQEVIAIRQSVTERIKSADATSVMTERVKILNAETRLQVKVWKESAATAKRLIEEANRTATGISDALVGIFMDSKDVLQAWATGGEQAARAAQLYAQYLDQGVTNAAEIADWQAKISIEQDRLNYLIGKFQEASKQAWQVYLDAAFSAIESAGQAFSDLLVDFATEGGDNAEDIVRNWGKSLVRILADAFAEILQNWIKVQLAMAATDYATKGSSIKNVGKGGVSIGGGGGIGGLQGFGGASGAEALGQYAAIAYGIFVLYKAFIEDHSRHFGSVTIGSAGDLQAVVGNSRRHMEAAQKAAQELLASLTKWMDDINIEMERFASVTIEHTGPGFGVTSGAQIIGMFATAEEAIDAAQAFMVRFGEFASSVPTLIQAAIRGTSELNMDAITANIEFARTLLTQNLDDIGRQMNDMIELLMSQVERSLELFTGADLLQATDSALLHFATSLQALYDQLTGRESDPREQAERQRQAFNLQRAIMVAQIILLMEEVRARIAAVQAHVLYLQRTGGFPPGLGWGPGGGGGQSGGGLGFGGGVIPRNNFGKGGGAYVEPTIDPRNPTNDPQLAALIQVLDNLARALAGLPPEIGEGGVRPGRGGGGGGQRQGARDFLEDRQFQFTLSGMDALHAQLAQINRDYQEQLEAAGRDVALRAQLIALREQETAAAIAVFQKETRARYDELVGNTNAFTQLHDRFEEVRKSILAAGYGADEAAAMLLRLVEAEGEAAQQLSDQMAMSLLGGIADYIDDAVVKQELLRQQAIIKFNMEMAQFRLQFELLKAQGLLTGDTIAAIEGALSWIAAHGNLLPGGTGYGGAPGFNPFANLPGSPNFNPGTQGANGQWSNVYIANGHRWAWMGDPMNGHWVDLGAVPGGDGGSGSGGGGGSDAGVALVAARDRARALLAQYQSDGLDSWHRALLRLNKDFETIRAALGNTPEVAQAYAAALARLREEFLQGLRDFYEGMLIGPESPLSVNQQFEQARANFQRLLAAVQGGDLSQAGALQQAAAQYQSLAAQMYGTSTAGYAAIFQQIRDAIAGILGITTGPGNIIGGPQWFAQGSQAQIAAINSSSLASTNQLSSVIDAAAWRRDARLSRIEQVLLDIRDQGGMANGTTGRASSIAIGGLPSRSKPGLYPYTPPRR